MDAERKNPERAAHVSDAAWLISLWKAIHGGDPAPDQIVAANIVSSMAKFLEGRAETVPSQALQGLRDMEIKVTHHAVSKGDKTSAEMAFPQIFNPPGYICCDYDEVCIVKGGKTNCHMICVQRQRKGTVCE